MAIAHATAGVKAAALVLILGFLLHLGLAFAVDAVSNGGRKSAAYLLPAISLAHLRTLTDDTGIHEFAHGTIPWHENGYCAEDVARALVAVTLYESVTSNTNGRPLAHTYLSYLQKNTRQDAQIWNRTDRTLANGDSYGRTLWGLGYAASYHPDPTISEPAAQLLQRLLPGYREKLGDYPIARACAVQGMAAFLVKRSDAKVRSALLECADANLTAFEKHSSAQWKWFSDTMTYDTGRLPTSMFLAFKATGNSKYRQAGLDALDFLLATCFDAKETQLSPIGNQGWFRQGHSPARFAQQPIDASSIVEACVLAWRITGDARYSQLARRAFEWFLGNNVKYTPLYDPSSGGCHDGLGEFGPNQNQGGESTVMYVIARCVFEEMPRSEHHE